MEEGHQKKKKKLTVSEWEFLAMVIAHGEGRSKNSQSWGKEKPRELTTTGSWEQRSEDSAWL